MDRATISTSWKTATDEFIDTNNPILEFIESKVQKGVSGSVCSVRMCTMPTFNIAQR